MARKNILIVGAGPAGLAAANELIKFKEINPKRIVVIEKNSQVGGLARSFKRKGHHFDLGPHRFYTKNNEVLALWKETLGKDFKRVKRLTRMLYNGKFILYPISIKDVVLKLGLIESVESLISYLLAKITLRNLKPKTFEDWIIKNFGAKLYRIFFKTYTEKVWGIPCNKIGSEWADQRVKNLNFTQVIKVAVFGEQARKSKSLVEWFYYPEKGAGQMYEALAHKLLNKGVKLILQSEVVEIIHKKGVIGKIIYRAGRHKLSKSVDYLFSSMPLTKFVEVLNPKPPKEILEASRKLFYRGHITVNMTLAGKNIFKDNWIYIHSPEVKAARVTNYNNFAKHVKNDIAISVEYFAFKNDKTWVLSDKELIDLAFSEMKKVNLLTTQKIVSAFVIREEDSYPTYYMGYKNYFNKLKKYTARFTNLQLIGRGGMYKYNNMDHSILTGMLAARNFLKGKSVHNIWQVNEEAEYIEKGNFPQ